MCGNVSKTNTIMTVPWKSWCRLCANPNGGVSVLGTGEDDQLLPEKIRKYVSVSISEEDRLPCLLCSSCCDQLAAFDNFAHRCLQVQAMFNTLCGLSDEEIVEDRLCQIRQDFLSSFNEDSQILYLNQKDIPSVKEKKGKNESNKSKNNVTLQNGRRKLRPRSKNKESDATFHQPLPSSTRMDDRRKSGRLKEIAELKRAFGEKKITYIDHSDTDSETEPFEDLMNSPSKTVMMDDLRGAVLHNSDGIKLTCSIVNAVEPVPLGEKSSKLPSEDSQLVMNCQSGQNDPNKNEKRFRNDDTRGGAGIKSEGCLPGDEENCDVLSSDVNCGSINSLSDADINDLIIDEDVGGTVDDLTVEDLKVNGTWKMDSVKHQDLLKESDKHKTQEYNLDEMFEDDDEDEREENNMENSDWHVEEQESGNTKVKKKSKSTDPPFFKCDKCDKSFHRRALLNVHLTSHVPKDQQPYVCCKCARRFHCESLLRNHERVHLPKEERLVFPCHVCSKKFSSRSAVSAHLKAIHFGERPFVCHLCGNSFTSKGILQEHLTIHSDDTPWHCTKCSKRFKTKYRLKIHMDTHRETPYSCPHCPIQLSTRRTLRMHLVVHRDTKAYQCSTCGKAFRRAKDLKNHYNLHTGRRPYTCPFCSRTFANGSNCRSHKRRMHPEELRLYEAALAANGGIDPMATTNSLEADAGNNNLIGHQDLDDDGSQSMKEDSQDTLITEMALDLQQQPQMLTVKSNLPPVPEDPVVTTAADLSLALPLTLTSTLPKLEPDDSRLVMNLTTQMNNSQDSMSAMSPLNLNIMSPLNLNISTVLPSPTGRHQQQHPITAHHQTSNGRYQQAAHQQPQQQPQQLTLQQPQHQAHHHQQPTHPQQHHHQHMAHQSQIHQHMQQQPQPQQQQQQLTRTTLQITNLQTSHNPTNHVQVLAPQGQLPAHHNHLAHHAPQTQTFVSNNQQGSSLYGHHTTVQDPMSPAALMAAAAMAHSMVTASNNNNTAIPAFPGNPYVHHTMAYGRGAGGGM